MKKSIKNLFIANAVISFIITVVFFLAGIMLMFNIAGTKDIYLDLLMKVGIVSTVAEAGMEVNMAIFDCIIAVLLNSYAAGIYLKISKAKTILIGASKVVIYVAILQCFFIASLLPGIIAIVGGNMLKKEEFGIANRVRTPQSSMDDLAEKIQMIKDKKEKGIITEEEYNQKLNTLLDSVAKQNIHFEPSKEESLQDKIANIRQEETKEKPEATNKENAEDKSESTDDKDKK